MRKASEYYTQSALLSKALEYARLGYPALPLAAGEKRPHGRLVPNGLKDATLNPEVLRGWWQAVPGAGVGILPPEQVLVLDVDDPESWDGLRAEYPELARAPRQKTPRGGVHVFLRLPESLLGTLTTTARKLPGLDLRGLGRAYLAASPTTLPNGAYAWEVPLLPPDELPQAPEGLLERLLPEPPPPPKYQPTGFRGVQGDKLTRRLEGLLRWACERVAAAPQGTRHNTLLSHARLIGGYLHLGLDPEQAAHALATAGVQAGLPLSEAEATARDGLRYGQAHPLALPESPRDALWAGSRSGFFPLYIGTCSKTPETLSGTIKYFGAGGCSKTPNPLQNPPLGFGAPGGFWSRGVLQNILPSLSQKPDFGAFGAGKKSTEPGSKPRLRFAKLRLGW